MLLPWPSATSKIAPGRRRVGDEKAGHCKKLATLEVSRPAGAYSEAVSGLSSTRLANRESQSENIGLVVVQIPAAINDLSWNDKVDVGSLEVPSKQVHYAFTSLYCRVGFRVTIPLGNLLSLSKSRIMMS
jgi:hypothetical protein